MLASPMPEARAARRRAAGLNADHPDSLCPGESGFLGETGQVAGIAGEQDGRPCLGQGHNGEQRVERAPMTRQPGPAEQLASGSAGLLVDRDDLDSAQDPVHARVPGRASQDLTQSRRRSNNSAVAAMGGLGIGVGSHIISCQFAQGLSIEDQGSAYSSS